MLIPVEEGRVYGYAARTRGGDAGSEHAWLAQAAAGFRRRSAQPSPRRSRAAKLHHAAVDEVRLEQWHSGRLVLIGDAAHATGPVWAQGVAMALEDALVLGELLALTPVERWTGVGPEFERLRRPRVEHVQSATDKMSRLAALPGWLRDVSAPILGPKNYRAAYAPLRRPHRTRCVRDRARVLGWCHGADPATQRRSDPTTTEGKGGIADGSARRRSFRHSRITEP